MTNESLSRRIARLQEEQPDASAAELAGQLRDEGHDVDSDTVRFLSAPLQQRQQAEVRRDLDDGIIRDSSFRVNTTTIRDYYRRLKPIYETLGTFDDGSKSLASVGRTGWYRDQDDHPNVLEADDWDTLSDPHRVTDTWPALLDEFGLGERRVLYNITSWADPDGIGQKLRRYDPDDTENGWEDGEKPLPDYVDLRNFGFWVDFDVDDAFARGELTDDQIAAIETAQQEFIAEVASLYDVDSDDILALDSGGGAYIYGPPEATQPLADYVDDRADRQKLFNELADRFNDWARPDSERFEGAWARVCDRVENADELLDPDFVQSKNHKSKAPLSLHADHDIVVTPLRPRDPDTGEVTETPDYTPTYVSEVDDELIAATQQWADELTTTSHREAVASLVFTLWPDYADDHDDWQTIIDTWLEETRTEETVRDYPSQAIEAYSDTNAGRELTTTTFDGEYDDLSVVTSFEELFAAIDAHLDVREIVREYACDDWDTTNRSGEINFNPSWRDSDSGASCAILDGQNAFIDNACQSRVGPVQAFALGTELMPQSENAAAHSVSDYWLAAVEGLREEGYPIPVVVPDAEASEKYDQTPYWGIRNAALAYGICDLSDLVEHETDDGDTYLKLPSEEAQEATLDALEDHGINHNWTRQHRPTPALPLERLKQLTPDEAERYARKRDLEWPDTKTARDRLETTLRDAFDKDVTVIEAPTSLGKSHAVETTEWRDHPEVTDEQPVVLLTPTHDIADEAEEQARDAGLEFQRLKPYTEACPVAGGEHDPTGDDTEPYDWPSLPESSDFWDTLSQPAFWGNLFETERQREENPPAFDDLVIPEPRLEEALARVLDADIAEMDTDAYLQRGLDTNALSKTTTDASSHDAYVLTETAIQATESNWQNRQISIDGDDPSALFETLVEHKGLPASLVHSILEQEVHGELPCCAGDASCELHTQWEDLLRDDDDGTPHNDLIIATHDFAHVPSLRLQTNLIFDEQPTFTIDALEGDGNQERVQNLVEAYLDCIDAPVTSWEEFVTLAKATNATGNRRATRNRTEEAFYNDVTGLEIPELEWFRTTQAAHLIAPALTAAIWRALEEGADINGRFSATLPYQPPRLDANANDEIAWNQEFLTVVLDASHSLETVRQSPDVSQANSVIGLDAWPSKYLWEQNVHPEVDISQVLSRRERQLWRRIERGLQVVQVGDNPRPRSGDNACEWFDQGGTTALAAAIREEFGAELTTGITTTQVEEPFEEALVSAGAMPEEVVTRHFGNEKGVNEFADENAGLVVGSMDPGDDYVLNLLAEAGLSAEPETETCPDCDGDGCDECDYTGVYRKHGREFTGSDADAAEDILETVRAYRVAQAAGRYARNPDNPEDTATVFVRTSALPEGFADVTVPDVEWTATDHQEEIISALRRRDWASAKELADATGRSKEHVRQTLTRLADDHKVEVRTGDGAYGANLYRASQDDYLFGIVDDAFEEIANESLWESSKWSLAIAPTEVADSSQERDSGVTGGPDKADQPPNTIPLRVVSPGG
jgi:hypothetical protein